MARSGRIRRRYSQLLQQADGGAECRSFRRSGCAGRPLMNQSNTKVLLMAAGLGTRLRPLTDEIPKCLVPIAGRPLLDYWLDLFAAAVLRDILINTHHLPPKVRS